MSRYMLGTADIPKHERDTGSFCNISFVRDMEEKVLGGGELSCDESVRLIYLNGDEIYELIHSANRIRAHFKGNKVNLCSIVNAKSGLCSEDCSFCSQSAHFDTGTPIYKMIGADSVVEAARKAKGFKSREFSIVASGRSVEGEDELDSICRALEGIKNEGGLERCASLGIISRESLLRLKSAGLESFHHNLETARSYFPNICTTHDYEDDVNTVKMARELGFRICSGGIFGLGESPEQRVELAYTLKELDVNSIPLNFLNPIDGTAMAGKPTVSPLEGLKAIAVFRFIMPEKDIIVSGGREVTFRDLQPMIFLAGANGTLIGNYLTTRGSEPDKVIKMIEDLGLEVAGYHT